MREAEANAAADKERREYVEAKNHADSLIHQVEKTLKENEGKVAPDDKTEAESAIADVRRATEGTDAAALKSATERLSQVAMKISEAMYKAQQAGAGPQPSGAEAGPSAAGPSTEEKVVDAEFEEVD